MNTPREECMVEYPDFNDVICLCLKEGEKCHIARSDVKMAFHNLCIKKEHWPFLVMKARSPINGQIYYFFDKCLAFGASISCQLCTTFNIFLELFLFTPGNVLHRSKKRWLSR